MAENRMSKNIILLLLLSISVESCSEGKKQYEYDKGLSAGQQLHLAIRRISITKLTKLIQEGADLELSECSLHKTPLPKCQNSQQKNCCRDRTPLNYAAHRGLTEFIAVLLSAGANIEAEDSIGRRPIHNTMRSESQNTGTDRLKMLIVAGADLNAKDNDQYSPMALALNSLDMESAMLLYENGAVLEPEVVYKQLKGWVMRRDASVSLLVEAIKYEKIKTVRRLLKDGVNIDGQDMHRNRPLKAAIEKGNREIVKMLIQNGVNVHQEKAYYLDAAAGRGDIEIVKMLINAGIAVDDSAPNTALANAAYHGHANIVSFLLDKGANIERRGPGGRRPIDRAVAGGSVDTVNLLLDASIRMDMIVPIAPLIIIAMDKKHIKVINTLLDRKSDSRDLSSYLLWAVKRGDMDMIKLFINKGASVDNNRVLYGALLNHERIQKKASRDTYLKIIELLLKNGADPNYTSSSSKYIPLYRAISNRDKDVIALLQQYGGKVSPEDATPSQQLHLAAAMNNTPLAKKALSSGANPNVLESFLSEDKQTPLLIAIRNNSPEVARLLLENGADPNLRDYMIYHPAHIAAGLGRAEILKMLLENGISPEFDDLENMKSKRRTVLPLLHTAIKEAKSNETVKLLLEKGADPNREDDYNRTPLYLAQHHPDLVKTLLEHGANPNVIDGNTKRPLFMNHRAEVVELLLKHGADIKGYEKNLLRWALKRNNTNIVKYLINTNKIDPKQFDNIFKSGLESAIGYAARHQNTELVKLLLSKGVKPDAASAFSAIGNNNMVVLKLLLNAGIKPHYTIHNKTVYLLAHAVNHGNLEIIKMLLENGSDINTTGELGESMLHIAARAGHVSVINFFLEKGLDIHSKDNNGNGLLHYVALNDFSRRRTVSIEQKKQIIQLLIDGGCQLEEKNERGQTPLFTATIHNKANILDIFIEKGANSNIQDHNGLRPIDYAVDRKFTTLIDILTDAKNK
jgi:ankyrin repeat protein